MLSRGRKAQLRRLASAGELVGELAAVFGIGRATAYRYLSGGRFGQAVSQSMSRDAHSLNCWRLMLVVSLAHNAGAAIGMLCGSDQVGAHDRNCPSALARARAWRE